MDTKVITVEAYFEAVPEDRKVAMQTLRKVVKENLPEGFTEGMGYGMACYVVPHSMYPAGYHCDPKMPLPFISIASQKNFIALHHMGIYGSKDLLDWFQSEYPKHSKYKLDMGKGCIRFKKPDDIPFALIAELCKKITVDDWITLYESNLKR
ncbi:MAG: hypothetical protein CFE23_05515 [Flavobacterium sp. BFFFF1]|uniref:DUF1801 domain-containing protein n=1 Tax=Flavobacterium sp. BFFFF1 TaxID=2015557 RepID=UPI000BCBC20A|nr:DUF1801 domain-containing protein [Flavobacterium sp. BFFFF1]OYU81223.1 MAG: hypothetical protein CFE23_05515 [Flavobacterium sp. BFFFF1]